MKLGEKREALALNRIVKIVICCIAVFIVLSTFFFIKGTYNKLDKEVEDRKLEIKNEYSFTNIEKLDFLKTDEVRNYKKLVRQALAGDNIDGKANITVLDTITKNNDEGIYEWLITCDDKTNSMYSNIYSETDGNISIQHFEAVDTDTMNDEDLERIKDAAAKDDLDSEYVTGSISDIAGIEPTIKNLGNLSGHIDDSASTEINNKLREFLVETDNPRRTYTVSTASVEEKEKEVLCVLHPEIKLSKNNTIKVSYSKSDKTFTFEYTD